MSRMNKLFHIGLLECQLTVLVQPKKSSLMVLYVAVCRSVSQYAVVRCILLQCAAVRCSVM